MPLRMGLVCAVFSFDLLQGPWLNKTWPTRWKHGLVQLRADRIPLLENRPSAVILCST
jgi:hypothetical protein